MEAVVTKAEFLKLNVGVADPGVYRSRVALVAVRYCRVVSVAEK